MTVNEKLKTLLPHYWRHCRTVCVFCSFAYSIVDCWCIRSIFGTMRCLVRYFHHFKQLNGIVCCIDEICDCLLPVWCSIRRAGDRSEVCTVNLVFLPVQRTTSKLNPDNTKDFLARRPELSDIFKIYFSKF